MIQKYFTQETILHVAWFCIVGITLFAAYGLIRISMKNAALDKKELDEEQWLKGFSYKAKKTIMTSVDFDESDVYSD